MPETTTGTTPIYRQFSLQGNLVFDSGLPAAGIVTRLYSVGFAGQDSKLGETTSDAQGKYAIAYAPPQSAPPTIQGNIQPTVQVNIQVRVVDATGKEVTISKTKFNAQPAETLNLTVPSSVQPPAPEFHRLSADMEKSIGGVAKLGEAQETTVRQDLTLVNQSSNWDARVVALAATADQQVGPTGISHDALYALFRVGLPTDPALLSLVPVDTVQQVLTKANQAGIVALNQDQVGAAINAFKAFSSKTQLSLTTPGAVSNFGGLLSTTIKDPAQQSAFTNLYLTQPIASDFWSQAAALKIPAQTLDVLKLQGKLLYLTFNSAPLAQQLQKDIGSVSNISQIVNKDYYRPDAWQNTLTALAGTGGDQALAALIPTIYPGQTTSDRLTAYSADLARKVRLSFPTESTARMIDNQELALPGNTGGNVSTFLKAAAPLGFKLGRTPLNAFLNKLPAGVPALDVASTASLKTLHRLYQITPSSESLQAAVKLGFTSARDIASYSRDQFLGKYSIYIPPGEGEIVFGQAQTVSSVTFNFFALAKQLDTTAPAYAISASESDFQKAKNAIVQQFPTMASLFGNLDFCQCDDCRSVLSPAAYFVDVLEFLNKSGANSKGYTPLDVLIGKDTVVPGRRPDLAALPLSCENTNTAMPYIDLVNEILEYDIANSHLDASAAYDTGTATTAELTAEPQHILPLVYNKPLKQAVYPLNLPFDLWIETVRGFLNYFKEPFAQVLLALRSADTLELFTDANNLPYYLAQILSESLGLSPSEYGVLTVVDPVTQLPSVTNWFQLYGYADEPTALSELKSAKTLSQRLGLTYQDLTNLVTTGFLNPSLYSLIFQFQRFGIEMSDAFSYTGQPGYPAFTAPQKATFEALLDGITAQYKAKNSSSSFDARAWLTTLLPANYSKKVLVLDDPNTGCDFAGTILQYADGSPAAALDYLRFNLFTRLWKKLGWTLDETDRALQLFFPSISLPWSDPGFAAAFSSSWKTALVYLAHLDDLNTRLSPALGRTALLPLWSNLPAQGIDPLYAQLFLTSSVLNGDWAFDDPNGQFPTPVTDFAPPPPTPPLSALSAHLPTIQGVLSLTSDEITKILADAAVGANPSFTLNNLSICYRYSALAQCLQLSVEDLISLKALSGVNPFQPLAATPISVLKDDVLYSQTLLFVKQVAAVQNSGFSVEDLKYLLRQDFDPVGKYQVDPNALIALFQTLANGLSQIQTQNAVPSNLSSMPESLIDQTLSRLFSAGMLTNLFALLANSQTVTATALNVLPVNKIDPAPFAAETEISFAYDPIPETQSVTFTGLLLNWKKSQLEKINTTPLFSGLLDQLQANAQQALAQRVGDLLGVWASLAEYEAVQTAVPAGLPAATLMPLDSALSLAYDQSSTLQWLGYRGVLTDTKKGVLTAAAAGLTPPLPALLSTLLNSIQEQTSSVYTQLVGSILAMWVNLNTYVSTQPAPAPLDSVAFFSALSAAQKTGTITDPLPQIQFSYDPIGKMQTLSCTGVLTDAMRLQLESLPPAPPLLGTLLQDVRNQAVAMFQLLAPSILTVTPSDLDTDAKSFIGIDASTQRKQVKVELVEAFLPLLARKLSRQLVLDTLSSNLASDPILTEALVTDAALLSDPSNPGTSLMGTFLAGGAPGVSAMFYVSTDGTGPSQSGGIAVTTATTDPTNSKPGTASARFEGYLQVPTDGPYRFFAELCDTGAAALVQIDSPDPTALFPNPVISPTQKAVKPGDEVSQFVQLKGGVAYPFTLLFSSLGTNGASLLIQGETLPKGPLSQITLYPQQSFVSFTRAKTLLSKVLQILQVTGLDVREISYLIANASQFNNLKFSSLPTQPSDDSPANAATLFSQFLTLADYANLREGPAGGTDGLIDVFQAASQAAPQEPNTPWTILANLTRRDSQIVHDVASALGPDPHFTNNVGIRRIWEALQLVQIVGIPVASLAASTLIVSPKPPASPTADQIATSFKNAVQAQYTAVTWMPIAQSVFDKLRQKKRDALVAYLVQALDLENSNELFEYFLVDPAMEPVVQTSRLRLAMSSLQTFIQRCLLNLENANSNPALNVSPSAIESDTWEWMKRYRVWQANREIFLYPENWMEPELRLDKSDLFQTLEGTLLQGDVTNDLVENALLQYLQDLDVRARLDIVASYLEQDPVNAGYSTLHVLGRTYSHPHKYFYRTFASGAWSAWEAVTPSIEGDHIALAVWRGRLNLFWVTFIAQPQPPQTGAGSTTDGVGGLSFTQLTGDIFTTKAQQRYQLQLHWADYQQGKWSKPIASDVSKSSPIGVSDGFVPSMTYLRVSTETTDTGSEGAINIHLDFPLGYIADGAFWGAWVGWLFGAIFGVGGPEPFPNYVFRVTSKNCDPIVASSFYDYGPTNPYNTTGIDATLRTGSGTLSSSFQSNISSLGTSTTDTEPILQSVHNFSLLSCSNPVVPSPQFLNPHESFYQDAGSLVSPFFFKDSTDAMNSNELTFFVQPSLTETTIIEWFGWAIPHPLPPEISYNPGLLHQIPIAAQVPIAGPIQVSPVDPIYSVYPVQNPVDWLTSPATIVSYGGALIGKNGGINLRAPAPTVTGTGQLASSPVPPDRIASVAPNPAAQAVSTAGTRTTIGKAGLTLANLRSIQATQASSKMPSVAARSRQTKS